MIMTYAYLLWLILTLYEGHAADTVYLSLRNIYALLSQCHDLFYVKNFPFTRIPSHFYMCFARQRFEILFYCSIVLFSEIFCPFVLF